MPPVGYGGMLPRKFFENLRSVIAMLVLFKQFLRKILWKFLPLTLSVKIVNNHF